MGQASLSSPAVLLRLARDLLAEEMPADDPMAATALHLISCAAGVVTLLPAADLTAAREALGCARAAVTAATYAVQRVHDDTRMALP